MDSYLWYRTIRNSRGTSTEASNPGSPSGNSFLMKADPNGAGTNWKHWLESVISQLWALGWRCTKYSKPLTVLISPVKLTENQDATQISLDGQRFKYNDPTTPAGMLANDPADPIERQTAAGAESNLHPVQSHATSGPEQFEGTIDMNEMVENLLDDPLEPVDRTPETPHMANFDDSVRISNSMHSLRLDGFENSTFGSPSMSKPRIPTPERRDNLPSPSLPSLSFYSNRPSYYGNDETWQSRPTSGSAYPGGGWLPHSRPNSTTETQRPNSRYRTDALWGHSHHISLPEFAADNQQRFGKLPMTPQVSAAIPGSPATTGFNYAVNTPSPTLDHEGLIHGPPPGLGYNPMARNWRSSSHVLEGSGPRNPSLPSS